MTGLPATAGPGSVIEHADALDWLAAREPGAATAIIFDPPYAVGTPVRGREDGAAGRTARPGRCRARCRSCSGPCRCAPGRSAPAALSSSLAITSACWT